MKESNRRYENRVKRNAVIIFILATLLCNGMIYYIVNVKNSVNIQKDNIKKNEKILKLTNELVENINKVQSYSNLFSFSANDNHLNNFDITIKKISKLNDSIIILCNDDFDKNTLNKIIPLLKKKEGIIKEIDEQFKAYNPYQEIYKIINNFQIEQNNTAISKTSQDTIIYRSERKSFFKRLGEVFNPDNSLDSVVLVTKTTIDTISTDNRQAENLLNEIQLHTEKGRKEYLKEIETIETKYNNLIMADQQISKDISSLLILLHKNTVNSVILEIALSENIINKNINFSIIIATVALIIILTFIILIFHNVKKVIAARTATEQAKKRTEEIMESRHKLLLSVSHDIKAPLSSILGYLELMQIDNNNVEDKRKINSMKHSADHILSLLTNLLNFSRLDQGKESIITSEFNINSLCDELNDMFSPLAENKQLSFVYKNNLNHDIIKSDALKIKQILSNLLSNAIKYTINGTIVFEVCDTMNFNSDNDSVSLRPCVPASLRPTINTDADSDTYSDSVSLRPCVPESLSPCAPESLRPTINTDTIIFKISDEGIGIPDDKLKEIFKPFSRIDNNESLIEGNGFGLFVVKGLIDLLNGEIDVKSEPEKGSEFIVKIPVEFMEDADSDADSSTLRPCVPASLCPTMDSDKSNPKHNILVIDDDNTLLTVIESMIRKIGYRCDICRSPIEFENYLKDISYYDIILTDREMGAFNGLEVLKKVKSVDADKKVVLMTARSEYNKEIAHKKGFDNYLRKPFSIKDLSQTLDTELIPERSNPSCSKYQEDFPELCLMFDNDDDSIENILRTFVETTSNNLVIFNEIINDNRFDDAVNLCHKMYPMFVQLGKNEEARFLSKMDKMRGLKEDVFPEWKEESVMFMNSTDDFINTLFEKYGIE